MIQKNYDKKMLSTNGKHHPLLGNFVAKSWTNLNKSMMRKAT